MSVSTQKKSAGKWHAGSAVEPVSFGAYRPVMVIDDPDALIFWDDIPLRRKPAKPARDCSIRVMG